MRGELAPGLYVVARAVRVLGMWFPAVRRNYVGSTCFHQDRPFQYVPFYRYNTIHSTASRKSQYRTLSSSDSVSPPLIFFPPTVHCLSLPITCRSSAGKFVSPIPLGRSSSPKLVFPFLNDRRC